MSNLSFKQKALIGLTTAAIAAAPAAALAWHPVGKIKKEVMNVTQNIAYSDANTSAAAVNAKPGDTLKYRITVSNVGATNSNGSNDMHYVVMTDKFPAGITAATMEIKASLGVIQPTKSVVKEYTVKVAANADGLVKNTACYTGDSKVYDQPQKGCDDAYIKVTKPATPSPTPSATPSTTPTPSKTPTPTATPSPTNSPAVLGKGTETPTVLPETGTAAALGALVGLTTVGYATSAYLRSRKSLVKSLKSNR
jgi:uncharacterized repeat protein (TIGR01451 family)